MNVPRTGRKTVSTLDGIDTSMSTVIQRSDGTYEVFESSARGMEKLTREGYVSVLYTMRRVISSAMNYIVYFPRMFIYFTEVTLVPTSTWLRCPCI